MSTYTQLDPLTQTTTIVHKRAFLRNETRTHQSWNMLFLIPTQIILFVPEHWKAKDLTGFEW